MDSANTIDAVLLWSLDNIWLEVSLLDDNWEVWLGENCWLFWELDTGKVDVLGWIGTDELVEVTTDCTCSLVKEDVCNWVELLRCGTLSNAEVCSVCKVGRTDWVE